MWVSGVSGSSVISSSANTESISGTDFLKMLITQLSNQDPMNPMSNQDFSAQMAQFGSLDQLEEMNKNMNNQFAGQSLGLASALIGKKITAIDSKTADVIEGMVNSVAMINSVPYIDVAGKKVSIYDVTNIALAQ